MTLDNYPTVRPAQTLDFAKSRYLPPEVTFARATPATNGSDGTYVGPTGINMSDENTPRFTWQNGECQGLLIEESKTNLLLNSGTLATQNVTATATVHTLSFYGTGSVALSGAATGTLAGTGANNRVYLNFTPAAGTLTVTVTGTVR